MMGTPFETFPGIDRKVLAFRAEAFARGTVMGGAVYPHEAIEYLPLPFALAVFPFISRHLPLPFPNHSKENIPRLEKQ